MPLVDALRLLAALMVMSFHYLFRGYHGNEGFSPLAFPDVAPIAKYGFLGVHLFFMISGLVIAYSSRGRTATQFAAARASRLIPGAWASITFLFLVFTFFPLAILPTNIITWLANLTFLPQALHAPMQSTSFWTIQIEIAFYVWVAILIAANLWKHTLKIITAWLVICAANDLILHSKILDYVFLTKYGPLFSLGILLFHAKEHGFRPTNIALMFATLVLSDLNLIADTASFTDHYHAALNPVALTALLCAGFLLLAAATCIQISERWQRACYVLGGITYPLYLVHESWGYRIFWWLNNSNVPAGAQFAIAAGGAIVVAAIIWAVVEQPLIPRLRGALQNLLARFLPVSRKAS